MNADRRYPVSTKAGRAGGAEFLSLEDIRLEIGLFDDNSHDRLLMHYRESAVHRIEQILGYPVVPATIIDGFASWPRAGRRLELSGGFYDDSSVPTVVQYCRVVTSSRQKEVLTLPATKYRIDKSGRWPAIVILDSGPELGSAAAPVTVTWRSAPVIESPAREVADTAFRILVSHDYETRGTRDSAGFQDAQNAVWRLLRPHRRRRRPL